MYMLESDRKIFHITCNLNVTIIGTGNILRDFLLAKLHWEADFLQNHILQCGKLLVAWRSWVLCSFPFFFNLSMEAQRSCNLSEGVWQSGNLNLDLCNPSWVSQGMVVLVNCYSRFLWSSVSGARLAYQRAATWSLFSLHNLSCLWNLWWEIRAYQAISLKNEKDGGGGVLAVCTAVLNSPGFSPGVM